VNKIAISAAVLTTLLICLAVIGMNKPLNNTIIEEIESKMVQLEQKN
jgi:hypothetical protein